MNAFKAKRLAEHMNEELDSQKGVTLKNYNKIPN
jgi:hypothetical protein